MKRTKPNPRELGVTTRMIYEMFPSGLVDVTFDRDHRRGGEEEWAEYDLAYELAEQHYRTVDSESETDVPSQT